MGKRCTEDEGAVALLVGKTCTADEDTVALLMDKRCTEDEDTVALSVRKRCTEDKDTVALLVGKRCTEDEDALLLSHITLCDDQGKAKAPCRAQLGVIEQQCLESTHCCRTHDVKNYGGNQVKKHP